MIVIVSCAARPAPLTGRRGAEGARAHVPRDGRLQQREQRQRRLRLRANVACPQHTRTHAKNATPAWNLPIEGPFQY